jgi:hypothetical protein
MHRIQQLQHKQLLNAIVSSKLTAMVTVITDRASQPATVLHVCAWASHDSSQAVIQTPVQAYVYTHLCKQLLNAAVVQYAQQGMFIQCIKKGLSFTTSNSSSLRACMRGHDCCLRCNAAV